MSNETFAIGVDIGGTFTDGSTISDETGMITVGKTLTTPEQLSTGFFNVIDRMAEQLNLSTSELLGRTSRLIHGTTTGTNAIVARHGVSIGLLTTMGHSDVMRLMRGGGRTRGIAPDRMLHAPSTGKPEQFVPPGMIAEVAERIRSDGEIITPISRASVLSAARDLVDKGAEALAISFLWSIRNPSHEEQARAWITEEFPGLFVTSGHEVVQEMGEFARTMTTVMNAYIGPLMVNYVSDIEQGIAERGYKGKVLFSQCAGGAITGDAVCHTPIQTLQSGPVAGILASAFNGREIERPNIITADMGGTTLDVGIISKGEPSTRHRSIFERFDLALPMLALDSIGAGGGSIAWIDELGRLQVGPKSAGARPGPVCYGRGGTEPTVTDADVVLGIIDPDEFAHGSVALDVEAAEAAIARVAKPLGLTVLEAAAGIVRIVDSRMGDLVRRMSMMRGYDPRNFVLYAIGGAGPLHAGAVAREASVPQVVVPMLNVCSVFSAFGAACGDIVQVFSIPQRIILPAPLSELAAPLESLLVQAREAFARDGLDDSLMQPRFSVRMKYCAQVHDISVDLPPAFLTEGSAEQLQSMFLHAYESQFGEGAGMTSSGTEVTTFELRAVAPVPKLPLARLTLSEEPPRFTERSVYWDELGDRVPTPVLKIDQVLPKGDFVGPMLIDLPDTVIVVRPGHVARFDVHGNVMLELGEH